MHTGAKMSPTVQNQQSTVHSASDIRLHLRCLYSFPQFVMNSQSKLLGILSCSAYNAYQHHGSYDWDDEAKDCQSNAELQQHLFIPLALNGMTLAASCCSYK